VEKKKKGVYASKGEEGNHGTGKPQRNREGQ